MKYKIIQADLLSKLESRINEAAEEGYLLDGPIQMFDGWFVVTMISYRED